MGFDKESLYGWGVCQVPMPRARNDIYADRRRGQQSVDFPERRTSRILRPFGVIFAAMLREDFPALQTGFVVLTASLLLMIFGLTTREIAPPIEPASPEPIEIATRLLQEPLLEPPVAVEPAAVTPQPRPRLQPQPPAVVKQPVVKKVAPQPKKIIALPQPRVEPQPRPLPRKVVVPVERPAPMPQKTVTLPALRQQTPLVTTPAPSRPVDKYTLSSSAQPNLASARPTLGSRSNLPVVAPRKASPTANYRLKQGVTGQPALAQGKSFAPTAAGTTVDLPSTSGRRSDFSVPRSQGGHAVATAGRSFAPKPGQSTVDIASAGAVAGSYAVPSSQAAAGAPLSGAEVGDFAGPTASSIDLPVAPGRGVPAAASGSISTAGSGPPDSAVHFVGDGEAGADPNLFISLNQLDACVDQGEEDRLRTELAIRLDEGGIFPCNQMKFHIDYVETGQTVQMRIYNPRNFADKCAALLSAIECIDHSQ